MGTRFPRDTSLSDAAAIVSNRVRSDARYTIVRESIIKNIVRQFLSLSTPEDFRRAGGRSVIAAEEVRAFLNSCPAADVDVELGSKMFPWTIRTAIEHDVSSIATDARYRECAERDRERATEAQRTAHVLDLLGPAPTHDDVDALRRAHAPAAVGCKLDGDGFVAVGDSCETTVPGVYAAGDCTPGPQSVALAVAEGAKAAAAVHQDLRREDTG